MKKRSIIEALVNQIQYKDCYPNCSADYNNRIGIDMECPFILALIVIDQSRRRDESSTRLLCHTNIFLIFSI